MGPPPRFDVLQQWRQRFRPPYLPRLPLCRFLSPVLTLLLPDRWLLFLVTVFSRVLSCTHNLAPTTTRLGPWPPQSVSSFVHLAFLVSVARGSADPPLQYPYIYLAAYLPKPLETAINIHLPACLPAQLQPIPGTALPPVPNKPTPSAVAAAVRQPAQSPLGLHLARGTFTGGSSGAIALPRDIRPACCIPRGSLPPRRPPCPTASPRAL